MARFITSSGQTFANGASGTVGVRTAARRADFDAAVALHTGQVSERQAEGRFQFVRAGGIDHLPLAQHMHVVDELERQVRVLLDQEDGQAFLLELADRFPDALADDRRGARCPGQAL